MFIDEIFPEDISNGAQGGPRYSTSRTESLNGKVKKNINWEYPLHSYDVAFGVRSFEDLHKVLSFFHVAEGAAHSFRFKDWFDYKSCLPHDEISRSDQLIGTGDGTTRTFQLVKRYTVGPHVKFRRINKPRLNTLIVAFSGLNVDPAGYTVDEFGRLTFLSAPTPGTLITAGYEFDVPVSFEEDDLPTNLDGYDNGTVNVVLTEERLTP